MITGPTASGKTALAVEVARRLDAHIISADSRQIYKGIPITTAVPTAEEKAGVPHHLLEFLTLDRYYSAAAFEADATRIIRERAEAGDSHIVVCGGSMMYVDALLYGLDELPSISDDIRRRVHDMYNENGLEGLLALLDIADPEYAATIDRRNPRRVMHATELYLQSGRKVSEILGTAKKDRPFTFTKYVLTLDRGTLFNRINKRVDRMVAAGMEEEARSVYHLRHYNSLNTIGFKEWFACFDGLMERDVAIARITKNTRVFAKKQLTWLNRQSDVRFLDPEKALETIIRDACSAGEQKDS